MAKTIKKMEVFQSNAYPLLSDSPCFMINKFECVGGGGACTVKSRLNKFEHFLGRQCPVQRGGGTKGAGCSTEGQDQGLVQRGQGPV